MSDMQPGKGVAVSIGGLEWHLLFTWAAVDKVQDLFQLPLSAVMKQLSDPMETFNVAGKILAVLIEEDMRRSGSGVKPPTAKQLMDVIDISQTQNVLGAIIRAYHSNMPQVDEEEDDEEEEQEAEMLNIPRLLLIGTTELKLTEDQFWDVTPRKFFRLVEEYQIMKGITKPEQGIDDLP